MTGSLETRELCGKACVVYCTATDADSYGNVGEDIIGSGGCGICVYHRQDDASGVEEFLHGVRHDDPAGMMELRKASHLCIVEQASGESVVQICRESLNSVEAMHGDAGRIVKRMVKAWCEENVCVVYLVAKGVSMVNDILYCLEKNPGLSNIFTCLVVERTGYNVHDIVHSEDRVAGFLRPPQSFMFVGNQLLEKEIDQRMVGVFVYRQSGSTRVDSVKTISNVEDVYRNGAHKCIPAQRILYEVAYKIGYSKKYGA